MFSGFTKFDIPALHVCGVCVLKMAIVLTPEDESPAGAPAHTADFLPHYEQNVRRVRPVATPSPTWNSCWTWDVAEKVNEMTTNSTQWTTPS
jgi:hypothetical protein